MVGAQKTALTLQYDPHQTPSLISPVRDSLAAIKSVS
jgi:hypothetical protein